MASSIQLTARVRPFNALMIVSRSVGQVQDPPKLLEPSLL